MAEPQLRVVEFINTFVVGGGEVQFVELLRGLVGRFDLRVCALDASGPLLSDVRALGLEPTEFRLRGSFVHPATAAQVVRLARYLERERAEVVHAHDFYSSLLAVPAARIAGCKVILSRLDLMHWHGRVRHLALAAATRNADHVVANADAIKKFVLEREGVPSEKVTVIRNGLDLAEFDRRQALGPTEALPETGDDPIAMIVANMHYPVKRHEDFLEALAIARQRVPRLQAFLVGDGARRAELEQIAVRFGVQSAAHFLGRRMDAPGIWPRATVGVLSSEREGLSNAIMEGMASRLPMVVTDAGGNAELVRAGERGWVVPVRQPRHLAESLVEAVTSPNAKAMGLAGRKYVEAELTREQMVEAHAALYARVAGLDAASGRRSAVGVSVPSVPGHRRVA